MWSLICSSACIFAIARAISLDGASNIFHSDQTYDIHSVAAANAVATKVSTVKWKWTAPLDALINQTIHASPFPAKWENNLIINITGLAYLELEPLNNKPASANIDDVLPYLLYFTYTIAGEPIRDYTAFMEPEVNSADGTLRATAFDGSAGSKHTGTSLWPWNIDFAMACQNLSKAGHLSAIYSASALHRPDSVTPIWLINDFVATAGGPELQPWSVSMNTGNISQEQSTGPYGTAFADSTANSTWKWQAGLDGLVSDLLEERNISADWEKGRNITLQSVDRIEIAAVPSQGNQFGRATVDLDALIPFGIGFRYNIDGRPGLNHTAYTPLRCDTQNGAVSAKFITYGKRPDDQSLSWPLQLSFTDAITALNTSGHLVPVMRARTDYHGGRAIWTFTMNENGNPWPTSRWGVFMDTKATIDLLA